MAEEPRWSTLRQLYERSYQRFPDRIAVVDPRGSLTQAQLAERARRIAAHLATRSVTRGDRVALVVTNRSEFTQIEHGLARGGLVRVGAITRLHPQEVLHILRDADPAYAFLDGAWLAEAGRDFVASLPCPFAVVGGGADGEQPAAGETFEAFLDDVSDGDDPPAPTAEDLAWFLYTSGTTGTPKGVVHSNRTVLTMVANILRVMPSLGAEDRALHTAPLPHFSGCIGVAVTAVGGTNRLAERFDPAEVLEAVETDGITVLPVVPTQLNALTDQLDRRPRDLSAVRSVPYAGSAIAPDRLAAARRHFGDALVQMYGSSEVPMPVTALLPEDHVATEDELGLPRFASAGRPLPDAEVTIRDVDTGDVLPAGARGEIVVRSPAAFAGYWRNQAATDDVVEPDGFCHTGDVGVLDREGFLFIVDRKKEMIVSGGFNVYPREVENALSNLAGVSEVAVVSAPDERWGEAIVAVIAPRPGVTLTLEQVQDHCRRSLASYKIPRRLVLKDELPKGGTGKLQKLALRDELWGTATRRVGG